MLSPLAFPENPYHRLVKDYKLVSESMNNPLEDARQAAVLFRDEFKSLRGLRQTEPGLFELLHYALATPEAGQDTATRGMELVFATLGGTRPSQARAAEHGRELLGRWGCRSVRVDAEALRTRADRLALPYAITWLRVARLSRTASAEWQKRLLAVRETRVVAMITRQADQDADAERRQLCRVRAWELPLVEIVASCPA